jgi:hypothetical protein
MQGINAMRDGIWRIVKRLVKRMAKANECKLVKA